MKTHEIQDNTSNVILIVDDSPDNLIVMKKVLEKSLPDVTILTCQYPEKVQALLQETEVSLAVLDVQMPKIDGLDLCTRIKNDPATPFVSVMLITSHDSDPKMKAKGMALGADDFITRPMDNTELCARVKVALRVHRVESILRDTAGQAEAEATRFSHVLEESLNEIIIFDAETLHFLNVNRGARENLGYSIEELREMTPVDIKPEMTPKSFAELVQPLRDGALEKIQFETIHRRKDGTDYPVESHLQLMANGPSVFVAIIIDITEHKQAEEALLASRETYRLLATNTLDVIWSTDTEFNLTFVNEAIYPFLGYTPKEFVGMHPAEFTTPESIEMMRKIGKKLMGFPREGELGQEKLEIQQVRKDGAVIDVELRVNLLLDGDGQVTGFQGRSVDITEHKQAEELLRESESRFRYLFETSPIGHQSLDENGAILELNETWCKILGYTKEEAMGRNFGEFIRSDFKEQFARNFPKFKSRGYIKGTEFEMIRKDGSEVSVSIDGTIGHKPDGSFKQTHCVLRDITEQKALEEQFRQAQKMDSIGQLVGGVAHDFNNLLQIINGYADLARMKLTPEHAAAESINEIAKAGETAKKLVQQLLAFSRQQVIDPVEVDLNEEIENAQKMLGRLIGEQVHFEFVAGKEGGTVFADKGQMQQVLMNLCVNARDAMSSGGTLTLETETVSMGADDLKATLWARPGDYVLLSVRDTGCGMDKETCDRIFDPFFTTKEVGKGTGLGLSTVYGILKQNKGHIDVDSALGKGTTFKIYLPVSQPFGEKRLNEISENITRVAGGIETILVVEDDEIILNMAKEILSTAGYTVLTANDGAQAVRVFEEHADEINCVIMDVVMPRMGGKEAMEQLLKKRPALRHFFVSGYSPDAGHIHFIKEKELHLLSKPYAANTLLRKIREVLDEG